MKSFLDYIFNLNQQTLDKFIHLILIFKRSIFPKNKKNEYSLKYKTSNLLK